MIPNGLKSVLCRHANKVLAKKENVRHHFSLYKLLPVSPHYSCQTSQTKPEYQDVILLLRNTARDGPLCLKFEC